MADEIVRQLVILRPQALIIAISTILAFFVLSVLVGRLKIKGDGYRLAGLFVGLRFQNMLYLSIAWIKLVFCASTLLLADSIYPIHYVFLLVLIVLGCLACLRWKGILLEVLSGCFVGAGFWVCANLLEYLHRIRHDGGVFFIRWLLAVLLVLCAAVIFVKEVIIVSGERKHFNENGETE